MNPEPSAGAELPLDLSPGSPGDVGDFASARATTAIRSDAVRGSWWTAVQAVVGLPLAIAANLIVARTLGPHDFGVLASYITAYAVIVVVLNAGISDATVQWGAAAYARGDREQFLAVARRCAGFHLLVEGPLGAIAAVLLLHGQSWQVRLIAAAAVAATMAVGTTSVVLTAMAKNAPLAKLQLVVGVALQASVVTTAIASGDPGPVWVARLVVGLALPVGALALADPLVRRATLTPLLPRGWPVGFGPYALKTLIATLVATLVFSRTELLVLDAYGDAAAAGLFALAAGLAAQITAPIDAMLGPLVPSAAGLLAVDRERAAAAVLRGLRLSGFATITLAVVAVPVVSLLAPLVYGGNFTEVGALFVALGLTSCLQSVLHPATAFATALRVPLTLLAINAVGLAIDLGLVFGLVPALGASAAVIGNCCGQVFSLAATQLLLRVRMGVPARSSARAIAPFLLTALVVAAVTAGCLSWRDSGASVGAAAAVAVGVSVLGAGLILRLSPWRPPSSDFDLILDTFPKFKPLVGFVTRLGFATAQLPGEGQTSP